MLLRFQVVIGYTSTMALSLNTTKVQADGFSSSEFDDNASHSHLNDLPFQGYNTFIAADEGGIEYDKSVAMINKHPTQSMFSMYSMHCVHSISTLNKQLSHAFTDFTPPRTEQIYSFCGSLYRNICFTSNGMKLILVINMMLVSLNVFLIVYEGILLSQSSFDEYYLDTNLPKLFFICDLIITVILVIEVVLHWYIGYMCSCAEYLCKSTLDNKVDVIVLILSILCCVLYGTNFEHSSDIDNLLFLAIRIIRDVIRIVRCYFFFQLIHGNFLYDFDAQDAIRRLPSGLQNNNFGKIRKIKSQKSLLLWDEYKKQRALHPRPTMLKVAPGKVVSSNKKLNQTENPIDFVFVASKV
eukprot:727297_1